MCVVGGMTQRGPLLQTLKEVSTSLAQTSARVGQKTCLFGDADRKRPRSAKW